MRWEAAARSIAAASVGVLAVLLPSVSSARYEPVADPFVDLIPKDALSAPVGITALRNGEFLLADGGLSGRLRRVSLVTGFGAFVAGYGTAPGQLGRARGVAEAPDGSFYAADGYSVERLSASGEFMQSLQAPGRPDESRPEELPYFSDVAVNQAGMVFVLNNRDTTEGVLAFDSNGDFVRSFGPRGSGSGQFQSPVGVAMNPGGDLFVVDNVRGKVLRFSQSGQFKGEWGTQGTSAGRFQDPRAPDLDEAGNLYVPDRIRERVLVFDADGRFLREWRVLKPMAVAAAGGVVAVAEFGGWERPYHHHVGFYAPTGEELGEAGRSMVSQPGDAFTATDADVDADGNLYVAAGFHVHKFDSDGHFLTGWGDEEELGWGPGGTPVGPLFIDVAPDGSVYVGANGIQRFSRDGELLDQWHPRTRANTGYERWTDMAVDIHGDLFLSTEGCRVYRFDAGGQFIARPVTGVNSCRASTVAVGPTGDIFLAGQMDEPIRRFSAEGMPLESWPSATRPVPYRFGARYDGLHRLDVDEWNNLYVADPDGLRVDKFSQDGVLLDSFGNTGGGLSRLFNPVAVAVENESDVLVLDGMKRLAMRFSDVTTLPSATLIETEVDEGQAAEVTVSLSQPPHRPVTLHASTDPGTASEDLDFVPVRDQLLRLDPGETTQALTVSTRADDEVEGPEQFSVRLFDPLNAILDNPVATVLIHDMTSVEDPDPPDGGGDPDLPDGGDDPSPIGDPTEGDNHRDGRGPSSSRCGNRIYGGARTDRLIGTANGDRIQARRARDAVHGLRGQDCLFGQAGSDTIVGGPEPDLLVGGGGADRLVSVDGSRDVVLCGKGRDTARVDSQDRLKGCERVVFR